MPDGVRLATRDVTLDRTLPLPAAGAGLYLFTNGALTRRQTELLSQVGLRYLGTVSANVYAIARVRPDADQLPVLAAMPNVLGTALQHPEDRLTAAVAEYFASGEALPHPLSVTFWPRATAAEIAALVPEAAERMRLPTGAQEPALEERFAKVAAPRSTARLLASLAGSLAVASVGFNHPKKSFNEASRALSNADRLVDPRYDLDGAGVVVGHWDGGRVSSSHRDFGGRVENFDGNSVSSHATHTAGTILGSGVGRRSARGYAPAATMVAYTFYGDAPAERRAAKHRHYHEHDNHSWGADANRYGGYSDRAREFDLDSRDLLMIGIKSAGNDGSRSETVDEGFGFDSLASDSTCKNMLVIGATDDDGDLTGFSSRGPTNDGRIKPDLSANGNNLTSTMPNGRYGGMSGTSMSAPSVTGIVTLMAQLWKRLHDGRRWAPDMIRGVLIHSVTDVFHTGPDYRHGWGNIDAQAAANLILADSMTPGRRLARGAVREAEVIEYAMSVSAGSPELKVTLGWLDAVENSTAQRRLLNDLDLELLSPSGEVAYPWTLDPGNPFEDAVRTRRNDLDNIEQVLVDAPAAGIWTVRITGRTISDPDLPVQGYVLATSHAIERAFERLGSDLPPEGRVIPDNSPDGIVLTFESTDTRAVTALRLHIEISHEERGDLSIELIAPDGTAARVEGADGSTRRDIYAIFPDLRSYDEDVASMYGQPAAGRWSVRVVDTQNGEEGRLLGAMLEIDVDGSTPPAPNLAPVANAGKDTTVNGGATVTLDASGSSDPDGDPIGLSWQQQSGPPVMLSDDAAERPTFVAPAADEHSRAVFRLTVSDGRGGVSDDDVIVIIRGAAPGAPNADPMARTNGDQVVAAGATFLLDASASTDPDGDPLTYRWQQTSGPELEIAAPEDPAVTLTATTSAGDVDLGFQVEVTDGRGGVDLASLRITVTTGPLPPPGAPPLDQQRPATPAPVRDLANGALTGGCGCATSPPNRTEWPFALPIVGLLGLRRRRGEARER